LEEIKREVVNIKEVHSIVKLWEIDTQTVRSKQDIIRDIQIREGNSSCFATKEACENGCLGKKDCLNSSKNKEVDQ